MNEELQKYLIEDLGRSFVTVPFGVYLHVCQEAHKEIGHKFPKLKMKDLTIPDVRLLYARYVYTMEESCVEFLKSIITGYTDFQWPDEVNKLITQRYLMESEGSKRPSLDEEEVKPLGKRAKLAECCEDDAISFMTESIESELLNDLDDHEVRGSYYKGRKSPDFTRFHNPEPPASKLGSRSESLRGSFGVNPTPPATPRKSNEGCSSSEQAHFIDPRMVKRPQERRRSGSICSTPSTADNESSIDGSIKSFISDGGITEDIANKAALASKDWILRKIAPYPHYRNYQRAEVLEFDVIVRRTAEDPRDLTQGYPRISRPDRLPREPTEECKTIPLNYSKENVQAPYVSEEQLNSSGLFDWKLGESESPSGSPKSFYDGDGKEEKEQEDDRDSDVVFVEEVAEEGEDVDPENFHKAYTRPRRKEPEAELEPPPQPPIMDSLPRFELTDIYRPPLLPPPPRFNPTFPPPGISPAFTSIPPPALSPIAGLVPLPKFSPSTPVISFRKGNAEYSEQSAQARPISNIVGHRPSLLPFPQRQMMMNECRTGVPFHYYSTGQYGNVPR